MARLVTFVCNPPGRRRNPRKTFAVRFAVAATEKQPAYVAKKLIDADNLRDAKSQAASLARQGKVEVLGVKLAYSL